MRAISHTTWSNALFIASLILILGLALVLLGIAEEARGRGDLLTTGGFKALEAYESRTQIESLGDFLVLSLLNRNPSYGGNLQGFGFAIGMLALPLVIALGVACQMSVHARKARHW